MVQSKVNTLKFPIRVRLSIRRERQATRLKGFRLKGSELRPPTFSLNPFSLNTFSSCPLFLSRWKKVDRYASVNYTIH
jgi:hypothetical protein